MDVAVTITPPTTTMLIDDTQQLNVTVTNNGGGPVSPVTVVVQLPPELVASVVPTGESGSQSNSCSVVGSIDTMSWVLWRLPEQCALPAV